GWSTSKILGHWNPGSDESPWPKSGHDHQAHHVGLCALLCVVEKLCRPDKWKLARLFRLCSFRSNASEDRIRRAIVFHEGLHRDYSGCSRARSHARRGSAFHATKVVV